MLNSRIAGAVKRRNLKKVVYFMQEAETAHVIDLAMAFVLSLILVWIDNVLGGWVFIWGLIFNVYPVFLQRSNQMRVAAILQMK